MALEVAAYEPFRRRKMERARWGKGRVEILCEKRLRVFRKRAELELRGNPWYTAQVCLTKMGLGRQNYMPSHFFPEALE